MEAKNVTDWLSWICDSKGTEELRIKYDAWASLYEADVDKHWRFMTVNAARALERVLPSKEAPILDAGAGTGLVGEALEKLGYTNITAVDLSEEMLEQARKKQVYKALHQCNLEDPLVLGKQETFDAIVAAGVFAYAHAGIRVLHNLFHLLNRGGFFVVTIRADYYHEMQEAMFELPWSLSDQEQFNIYETQVMNVLVFRKH